jgi:hypothetical protein
MSVALASKVAAPPLVAVGVVVWSSWVMPSAAARSFWGLGEREARKQAARRDLEVSSRAPLFETSEQNAQPGVSKTCKFQFGLIVCEQWNLVAAGAGDA